jgi:hypothetical protein
VLPRSRSIRRRLQGVAFVLAAAIVVGNTIYRSLEALRSPRSVADEAQRGKSPHTRAMARAILRHDGEGLPRALMKQESASERRAAGDRLEQLGLRRLDDRTLLERVTLAAQAYRMADERTCSAMFRGPVLPNLSEVLAPLDSASIERWMDIAARAMIAEARRTPAVRGEPASMDELLGMVVQALSTDDRARFLSIWENKLSRASAGDACWMGRTLYDTVLRLPEGPRRRALWTLTMLEAGVTGERRYDQPRS